MICPKCKRYRYQRTGVVAYCPDDGTRMVEFNCECGASLSAQQKFCEVCGRPCPQFGKTVELKEQSAGK